MKKRSNDVRVEHDELDIPPLPPEFFKKAVMGKHYAQAMANTNVVRIAPDLTKEFPNEIAVNDALRNLLQLREAITGITAGKRRKTA